MVKRDTYLNLEINKLRVSKFWSDDDNNELAMHRIHSYPAKFPSFVVSKSIDFAKKGGHKISMIADIFCGCGTSALEARVNGFDFWGCDINPVATLIAKAKSNHYQSQRILSYFTEIENAFFKINVSENVPYCKDERLNYWFDKQNLEDLSKLLFIIKDKVPSGKYQDFFLCAFSNILKGCSFWLTKSIKPQLDPNKTPKEVQPSYKKQFELMFKANAELKSKFDLNPKIEIETNNFLKIPIDKPFVDLLITSPPYVTSYEYADLHQLSSLWLGYTHDYRLLRDGSIGSLYYNNLDNKFLNKLNEVGRITCETLNKVDKIKSKSVAKYFLDIEKTVKKSFSIINPKGLAVFVIGNTKYKGVEVNNAAFLLECLTEAGFEDLEIFKRKISSKILTPYRDKKGQFSKNDKHRNVYSHEYVIVAKKT